MKIFDIDINGELIEDDVCDNCGFNPKEPVRTCPHDSNIMCDYCEDCCVDCLDELENML